jgi:hypothetical protein
LFSSDDNKLCDLSILMHYLKQAAVAFGKCSQLTILQAHDQNRSACSLPTELGQRLVESNLSKQYQNEEPADDRFYTCYGMKSFHFMIILTSLQLISR